LYFFFSSSPLLSHSYPSFTLPFDSLDSFQLSHTLVLFYSFCQHPSFLATLNNKDSPPYSALSHTLLRILRSPLLSLLP
jgi:hypothetical protein